MRNCDYITRKQKAARCAASNNVCRASCGIC
jgi:hypothetical protein